MNTENIERAATPYFHGNEAKYTSDKPEILYGGLFWEIELIEGHLKGEKRWIAA